MNAFLASYNIGRSTYFDMKKKIDQRQTSSNTYSHGNTNIGKVKVRSEKAQVMISWFRKHAYDSCERLPHLRVNIHLNFTTTNISHFATRNGNSLEVLHDKIFMILFWRKWALALVKTIMVKLAMVISFVFGGKSLSLSKSARLFKTIVYHNL